MQIYLKQLLLLIVGCKYGENVHNCVIITLVITRFMTFAPHAFKCYRGGPPGRRARTAQVCQLSARDGAAICPTAERPALTGGPAVCAGVVTRLLQNLLKSPGCPLVHGHLFHFAKCCEEGKQTKLLK